MYIDLEPILDRLEDSKEDFISRCRREVEEYVTDQNRGALSIREVGVRTHHAAPDNYLKVLYKFTKGQTYHNHQLESVLCEPIAERVVTIHNGFISDHQTDIETQLKEQVAASIDITSALQQILYEELRNRGIKEIRKQAADIFISGCQAAFHSQLSQATSSTVSTTVTHTVGTTVGASIAHALSLAIVHAIGTTLAHVAHTVAFKAAMKTVIIHSVGAIVTAVLIKLFAAHMTAASAGAFLGPAVWIAGGGYIFYKIVTIPDTLGEKLGVALADTMRGEFRPWTETALENCFEKMTDPEELLKSVLKAEMDTFMPEIAQEVARTPSPPPAYNEVEKDVGRLVGYGEKGINKVTKKKKWFGLF